MSTARRLARRVRGGLKRRAKQALQGMGLWEAEASHTPRRASPEPTPAPEPTSAPEPTPAPEPAEVGLTRAEVEELLEDMVRPALQADGGDITLVRVEPEGNVFVELVGACSTCPSATVTMRQGIERLMHAELDGFRSLVEINGAGGVPTDFH